MTFGDLKTNAGLKSLDEFLADNSYIEGFQPSQADTTVFQALKSPPSAEFPHALRWYNHIKSFGNGITRIGRTYGFRFKKYRIQIKSIFDCQKYEKKAYRNEIK
ncbi:elongation factor 1-beta [Trichonephila inaurata madagascariensis]|uniref:Elongation factor 1-beta n=1 Tax=Trichonephila inaurata madagascariensis TaxID=2747483 RepID=A0A8X6XAF7_9ARAC|nr:elongation factor 1-beta [Trichonephila inaurata madagascariensis]